MRVLLTVRIPHDTFNEYVRQGNVGDVIREILEETKPESIYFTEIDGMRGAVMVVALDDVSQVPHYAEPWFLRFEADVQFRVAMTPEDLERAGLADLGRRWS